jgi:hypothetical protein
MFDMGTDLLPRDREGRGAPQDRGAEEQLVEAIDSEHRLIAAAQRRMFALIADADRRLAWDESGARDLAHWLSMRYDISWWKAARWVKASHRLTDLPKIASDFEEGRLGLDKIVELTRFATGPTERELMGWAARVNVSAVRERADLALRKEIEET